MTRFTTVVIRLESTVGPPFDEILGLWFLQVSSQPILPSTAKTAPVVGFCQPTYRLKNSPSGLSN